MHLTAVSTAQPVWLQEILNSYEVDPEAQLLIQAISSADHPGFQLTQGLIRFQGRIWVGANVGLQTKLIQSFHSSPVGGHSGVHATYQHLKKLFYWKGINQAVEDFLKQCCICQQAKHEHCKSPGLLSPLPIPF